MSERRDDAEINVTANLISGELRKRGLIADFEARSTVTEAVVEVLGWIEDLRGRSTENPEGDDGR